jgi:hypothetical protein
MSNEQKEQQVRERAYALYLARNGKEGSPVEDWIRAEQELSAMTQKEPATQERVPANSSSPKRKSAYPARQNRAHPTGERQSVRKRY